MEFCKDKVIAQFTEVAIWVCLAFYRYVVLVLPVNFGASLDYCFAGFGSLFNY